MQPNSYDVVIIGAGPAGTAAAMELRDSPMSVAMIDKATFPRDKVCGDALSVDVVRQLKTLAPSLAEALADFPLKSRSGGVRIIAPGGESIDIPFTSQNGTEKGYVCRRKDFDMLMMTEARRCSNLTILEGYEVKDVRVLTDHVHIETSRGPVTANMLIAADGAHSVVKRKLMSSTIDRNYHSAGLRAYHTGLNGFNSDNFIELYFFRDILPGYLWMFPLPGDSANVGIGMLTSAVSAKKVNLRKTFQHLLTTHPAISRRIANANAAESPVGHSLPLGGKIQPMSGRRFLLTGDAASLIDPFSGEGIGNAIRSGRFAAKQAIESFRTNDFSVHAMRKYDKKMHEMLRSEFKVSYAMLRLSQYPWILNTIVKKANRNSKLLQTLIDALAYPDKKRWLINPMFYINLLFRS